MIPRVLHQVWIGGPVPERFAEWATAWRRLHPSWPYTLWGDEDLAVTGLRNQALWDAAPDIVPGHVNQFRADLARYEILHVWGGVYLDMDLEPLRPLDPLLGAEVFLGWEVDDVWANNAVMGAEPGHPFLDDLIDGLPEWVASHPGKRPNVLSGPQYLTPRLTLDVTVHPSRTFYPYLWSDVGTPRESGPFPDSYAVHHWNNTRSGRGARTLAKNRGRSAMPMSRRARRGR